MEEQRNFNRMNVTMRGCLYINTCNNPLLKKTFMRTMKGEAMINTAIDNGGTKKRKRKEWMKCKECV
jgi:hypothetical protein